jgi:hypothetical protein
MVDALEQVEFASLAAKFSPEEIILLRTTGKHSLYRLACRQSSYILKWCNSPSHCREPKIYALLQRYGISTLPVYEHTDRAIVLEDLQSSTEWRLAEPADMGRAATGVALAEWYQKLHQTGREALIDSNLQPEGVFPWVGEITRASLEKAGAALKLDHTPAWGMAMRQVEVLKGKYLALPQTFNYNDFAAENLALSRSQERPLRAIAFDYDCFASGAAYSDWRNVMVSLQGAAKASFQKNYGAIVEEEQRLDQPLAILYGLVVASQREKTPSWASPLINSVINGELEQRMRETPGAEGTDYISRVQSSG